MDANAAAPAIVNAARAAFWPMLLIPKLAPAAAAQLAHGADLSKDKNLPADAARAATSGSTTSGASATASRKSSSPTPPPAGCPPATPPGTTSSPPSSSAACATPTPPRPQHMAARQAPSRSTSSTPSSPTLPAAAPLRRAHRHRPAAAERRPHHRQAGRPRLRPLRTLHRRPRRPRQHHPQLVLGQSGNPASPWYMDQFQAWLNGTTYPLPFTPAATHPPSPTPSPSPRDEPLTPR